MAGIAVKLAVAATLVAARPDSVTRRYGAYAVSETKSGYCGFGTETHEAGFATVVSIEFSQALPKAAEVIAYVRNEKINADTAMLEAGPSFAVMLHRRNGPIYVSATAFQLPDMVESLRRDPKVSLSSGQETVEFGGNRLAAAIEDLSECLRRHTP